LFHRDTVANFFPDVNAVLAGNGDTDVTGDGGTFLTWEWDASFLFLDSTILLGKVGALGAVNALLTGNIGALLKRFLVANFFRYLSADLLGNNGSNGSGDGEDGSGNRDGDTAIVKSSRLALLGCLVRFERVLLGELGLLGGSLPDMARPLHGDDLALLFEMSYTDVLRNGLANLLDHGRTNRHVGALLFPDDVAIRNGVTLTLLLHDERTRLLVLGVALTGLESRTSWLGFDLTSLLEIGPTPLLPDFIDDGGTLTDDGHSRSDDRQSGNSREYGKVLALRSLHSVFEFTFRSLDGKLLFLLGGFDGVQILCVRKLHRATETNDSDEEL